MRGDPDMMWPCLNECMVTILKNGKDGAAMAEGARERLLAQQKKEKEARKRQKIQNEDQNEQEPSCSSSSTSLIVPDYLPSVVPEKVEPEKVEPEVFPEVSTVLWASDWRACSGTEDGFGWRMWVALPSDA